MIEFSGEAGEADFLKTIAETVRNSLVLVPNRFNRRVFLGGAAPGTPGSIREAVAAGLQSLDHDVKRWSLNYEIYYPESLFEGMSQRLLN